LKPPLGGQSPRPQLPMSFDECTQSIVRCGNVENNLFVAPQQCP
jgi:hypothetical protein